MKQETQEKLGRAYVQKYLGDEDIAEHIEAMQEDLTTETALYLCVGFEDTIEVRKREVELGRRDTLSFNDLGFTLATEGKQVLLFGVYLATPKDGDYLINYLTADGRTRARLLRLDGEDEWLKEVEHVNLLVSFMEGFFVGYRKKNEPPKPPEQPRIIMPGDEGIKKSKGGIIIP